MNASTTTLLERAAYVVFFIAAVLAVQAYKERHRPAPPSVPVSAEDSERIRKQEDFRKRMAEFKAKKTAGHAARVKRLGEAGAKAQEDRCNAELMAEFRAAVDDKPDVKTPDCDE